MWAPLGRKKQLPGLTSLKKNSSWSCAKTCTHGIYDPENTSSTVFFLPLKMISFYAPALIPSYRPDASVIPPPCLLLLPLPFLLVLLSWKGHTEETHQTRGLCLIGQSRGRQLGCSRYGVRRGWGERK